MPEQDVNDASLNGERSSEELVMSDMPTSVQDKYTILQLTRTKTSLQESNGNLVRQIEEARDIVVQHIVGDARASANTGTFKHVPLPKLIQVLLRRPLESKPMKDLASEKRKQAGIPKRPKKEGKEKIPLHIKLREKYKIKKYAIVKQDDDGSKDNAGSPASCPQEQSRSAEKDTCDPQWAIESLKKSEQRVIELLESNKSLETEIMQLKTLLASSMKAGATSGQLLDVIDMRKKQQSLNEQLYALKLKLKNKTNEVAECQNINKKAGLHLEKVLNHLKAEVAAKTAINARFEREQRLRKKERRLKRDALEVIKERDDTIRKVNEGARVLEGQLRLLDTRFLDMKKTLDWTRSTNTLEMKQVGREFVSLHAKIKENYELYRDANDKANRLMRDLQNLKKNRKLDALFDTLANAGDEDEDVHSKYHAESDVDLESQPSHVEEDDEEW